MMIHSTGFFFLVFFGAASAVTCPQPFTALAEICYYFSEETSMWHDARASCQGMSTPENPVDLAVFDISCEDYVHIFNHLSLLGGDTLWWLGGTNENHLDHWSWVDGRPVDMGKAYWHPEEPDQIEGQNFLHTYEYSEFYTRMRLGNYQGNDLHRFICQLGVQEIDI